jgi:hypothetical protein
MCKIIVQISLQMFKVDHQKQTWQGFHFQVCLMSHRMNPQIIRSICVMDLLYDTNPCALKNINTIKPQK